MIRTYRENAQTWYLLARGLKILKETREKVKVEEGRIDQDVYSLNSFIVLSSAATVEGAIKSLLINHVTRGSHYKAANRESDHELREILDDLINQVHKAQWKDLNEKAQLISGINLKAVFQNDWEAISFLFDFRNILAHGGVIVKGTDLISDTSLIEELKEETRVEMHNRKRLFDFLKKTKLIDKDEKNYLLKWQFLNSDVADFFLDNAERFLFEVYEFYSKKFPERTYVEHDLKVIKKISGC